MRQAKRNKRLFLFIAFLAALDGMVWSFILFPRVSADEFALYFFDVGQGDGALLTFPGGVQMLVDGGPPNGRLLTELSQILPPQDRYIDLVMLSHPQLDHFGGLVDLFNVYGIGTFLGNGKDGETKSYGELLRRVQAAGIQQIALQAGDRIRYGEYALDILSPSPEQFGEKELNESALVLALSAPAEGGEFRALFTGDIGMKTERFLANALNLGAQVLKVPHHGSKYSSSAELLRDVSPQVAVIGVGKNSYGHPTAEALGRLEAAGARVFRTDQHGTVKITAVNSLLKVYAGRSVFLPRETPPRE